MVGETPRRSAAPSSVTITPASLRGVATGPLRRSTMREAGSSMGDTPSGDWLAAHLPSHLPTVDELKRVAQRKFARSPAMDEIIARAREMVEQSVFAQLGLQPVPLRA